VLAGTIGASIAFVKATTTSMFAWAAGLLPALMPTAEWWRALGTSVQGAFLIPLLTLAVATLDRSRAEYDRLVAERARAMLLDAGRGDARAADDERTRLIAGFVMDARHRLSGAEERTVASVLERLVEERLRPMTRELWTPAEIVTDFRARSLIRAAVVANPLPTGLVALAYALTAFASRAQEGIDLATNVVRSVVGIGVIVAVYAIARRTRPSGSGPAIAHLLATITVTAALQSFLVERIGADALGWRASSLYISVFVWLAALTVLGGAGTIAAEGGDAVQAELDRMVASAGPHTEAERASQLLRDREVADHLHSSLQNRLISAAHRIAASGERPSVVREELDAIERLLDDLASGMLGDGHDGAGARAQFADVAARWEGFVDITADLDATVDVLAQPVQDRIAQVLIEAVNNAVRHGRAASVDMRLRPGEGPGTFTLTVDDDGVGPVEHDRGLGSALFDAMSNGDWTLAARPEGGSRLLLTLRTAAAQRS
jgi:signal transduction histidine kinase